MPIHTLSKYNHEISFDIPANIPAWKLTGGKPIFTAFECVLLERQTEKSHVYSALNLSTGKTAVLSRRSTPLRQEHYIKMAVKIRASSIAGASRLCVDQVPDSSLSKFKLLEIMNHTFTNVLPEHGFSFRKSQMELAEHILEALSRRGISLAESEVGTGKTLAYLLVAILVKRGRLNDFWLRGKWPKQSYAASAYMPIVIATSSISLQNAIVSEYIPQLSNVLMEHGIIKTPITCAVRKGKEHYICRVNFETFRKDASEMEKAKLDILLSNNTYDLAKAGELHHDVKKKICVSDNCSRGCLHYDNCRYLQYLEYIGNSEIDIQVTNHNYLLADTLHRAQSKRPLLPNYQMIIIDEAHKFLAAARQMYGAQLNELEVKQIADDIRSFNIPKSPEGVNLYRCAKKLEDEERRLFRYLRDTTAEDEEAERFPAIWDDEIQRHLRNIIKISETVGSALEDTNVGKRYKRLKSHTLWRLGNLKERVTALQKNSMNIYWLEKQGKCEHLTLVSMPNNLDEQLYADIWSKGIPYILTSGTLSAGGDFSRVKKSLGLSPISPYRLMETSKTSPFEYRNNTLLYLSGSVPFPNQQDKQYIWSVTDEVERLVLASHGHAAILFTAYKPMEIVFSILKDKGLPFPMFQMGKQDSDTLARFKLSGNGILFASGTMWEGIDIPGDTLSMLIIVKLPFAAPDPIGDYEKEQYSDMDSYKNEVLIPDMLVKLKQGFGRLIRTETDTGVCAILDSRAKPGAAYHDRVIAALPPCQVTNNIEDIKLFMRRNKPQSYFKDLN